MEDVLVCAHYQSIVVLARKNAQASKINTLLVKVIVLETGL